MNIGVRTLRVSPTGLFKLLDAISRGEVRAISDVLPKGCAIEGTPRWNDDEQVLEIDVRHHDWDDGLGPQIELLWAERLNPRDFGVPKTLEQPVRAPRS